jgi:hypothetical protein
MTDQPGSGGHARPLTYDDAESVYRSSLSTAGRERYDELTDRDLSASTTARLRERGEFDPANSGHQAIAAKQPLSADEHLERIAIGEALARYYRHPAMLDDAAKAGASWEQIGATRGTSAGQARQDYREWADGQHHLLTWTEGRFGMSDAEHAEAIARTAEPEPGAANAYAAEHPVLCAHAGQDGRGSHWLEPGETCAGLGQATPQRTWTPASERERGARVGKAAACRRRCTSERSKRPRSRVLTTSDRSWRRIAAPVSLSELDTNDQPDTAEPLTSYATCRSGWA